MKTKLFLIFSLLSSVLVSCAGGKMEKPEAITGLTDELYFEQVGKVESIGLVEHYELLIQQTTESNADGNEHFLAYLQEQLNAAKEYQQECINQSGANWDVGADGEEGKNIFLGYQYTTIRYKSIDHKGNPAMLSTLVVWPFNNLIIEPEADNVVIGCHVTIGSNAERPSNYGKGSIMTDVGMIACCAKNFAIGSEYGNLVIIPDYQGFGATHGEVHPYLSQTLTARQVLDGVRAGIAYYEQSHKLEKKWKSLSLGYSQGGSVAMAVHKYIEQNDLADEFNFAGSVCGNGPYDPLATLVKYIETDQFYMPVSAAMMMYSMCNTNPRLMGKYTPQDYLTEGFINSGVIERIEEKRLDTDKMQEELFKHSASFNEEDEDTFCMQRLATDGLFHPYRKDTKDKWEWEEGYIKTGWARANDVLLDDCLEYFQFYRSPKTQDRIEAMEALRRALEDNILYRDWTPAHPIFLYHTNEDEVVVVENFNNCLAAWEGSNMVKGAIYKGSTHTHVNYGKVFFMRNCTEGITAIFTESEAKYPFRREITGIW